MKKVAFFVVVLLTGFFLINIQPQFTVFSAKNEGSPNKSGDDSDTQERIAKDQEMARVVRRLTNRSTDGLVQKRLSNGAVVLDLDDRFQNVMLSRIDTDGDAVSACITSLDEANSFFGKNLETGEFVPQTKFPKSNVETVAAQHGMSAQEFEFYNKLIENAAAQRAASPNSATLVIVNNDGENEGFNDPTPLTPEGGNPGTTIGQQRLNLFNFAAAIWGAYLDTSVQINVRSQFNPLTCTTNSATLGSAGTVNIVRDFPNAKFAGTWYHAALANKLAGTDLIPANPEINATFNSDISGNANCLGGQRFYYGFDNSTPAGTTNLLVVLLHEMGHGLGFSSFVNGQTGALNNGMPDVFLKQMYDATTGKNWGDMTDAERQTSALNSNKVFWDGVNVKAASSNLVNGRDTATGRVMLYTPTTFSSGSSISHWSTAASPNLLMEPNITLGLPLTLDLTRQQMRDMGWYADATNDLIPDTITNVKPSGGTLVVGSTVNVTWTNTGGFNRNVTIELSTDGGATYPTTIASDIANSGSFSYTVPNTQTTQGRIRVRETNFVDPMAASSANFTISTSAAPNRTRFDFDGDGKADVAVFRPSTGIWYLQQSQAGFTGVQFGNNTDKVVPADYDGDGKTDVAVYRNGTWYLQRSSAGFTGISFGASTDIPAPGDFDGDGKSELAVFRPSTGNWYIYNLATNQTSGVFFGANEDRPVPADYDGDGKADVAVFRPSTGAWYIQRSQLGFTGVQFGEATDNVIPADYDGDGKADIAVFRPSTGAWYMQRSTTGFAGVQFGASGDQAAAADFDGDGKADVAVFRPSTGTWYLQRSTQGFTGVAFGANGDRAASNSFVQ